MNLINKNDCLGAKKELQTMHADLEALLKATEKEAEESSTTPGVDIDAEK